MNSNTQHNPDGKPLNRLSQKAKDIWMFSIGTMVVVIGWTITAVGLFLEPQGQIHSTVLLALGQAMVWSAAIFGVPYYVKSEFGEFKSAMMRYVNKKTESLSRDNDNSDLDDHRDKL